MSCSQNSKALLYPRRQERSADRIIRQPGSSYDSKIVPSEEIEQLDAALECAVLFGWPLWCTDGGGGEVPGKDVHDFSWMNLESGARVDFYRGVPSDDMENKDWEKLYEQLPKYRAYMRKHQCPSCTRSIGNAMEQACGVAYAAATFGKDLPVGSWMVWGSEEQQKAWARAWSAYQALGLNPQAKNVRLLFSSRASFENLFRSSAAQRAARTSRRARSRSARR